MGTLTWILAAIIFAVGSIFGMILVFSVIKKLGTMYVDMTARDETGVARFIFDKPLELAVKHKLMWIKIEERRGLNSIK